MLSTNKDGRQVYTWYDRQTRLWITQGKDKEGNQIGDADYSPNKKVALFYHKDMSNKIFDEV